MLGVSSSVQPPAAPEDAMRVLVEASDSLSEVFCSLSQRALRGLLKDPELLRQVPTDTLQRFSRILLFRDPVNRLGIWLLAWPPGFRTSIHRHHCSCAFGIYQGQLDEVLYGIGPGGDTVIEVERFTRLAGFVGGAPREHGLVHEMLNVGTAPAVSVHVYAYQPDRYDDSVERSFVRPPLNATDD